MECTEGEAIAALLHDGIEDGGGPAAEVEIRERFGPGVAVMVRANSDADIEPKPPWRGRKEAYIASVVGREETASAPAVEPKPIGAVRASIADKLHNAHSILADHRRVGDAVWDRFSVSDPAQVLWYYESLVDAFEARRPELGDGAAAALDELERTISEIRDRTIGSRPSG